MKWLNETIGLFDILEMDNSIDKVKELAIDGLITDGKHHKQWYLEQILIALDINLDELRQEIESVGCSIEKGITP